MDDESLVLEWVRVAWESHGRPSKVGGRQLARWVGYPNPQKLARALRPLGLYSKNIRVNGRVLHGYDLSALEQRSGWWQPTLF